MSSAFGDLNGTGNQQVWVYTSLSSQDVNGNYSQYYGEIRYYGNGWGSWTASTQYWSGSFAGQPVSGTFTIPQSQAYQSYTTLWTGYYNVGHDAAGYLAPFGISASIDTNHSSIGDGTASTTEGSPPTIPRASTPSFVGGATLTSGTAVTINTNWASSSFTHDIVWNFGSLSNQTGGFSASTGIGASLTWTPPATMLAQIPNSTSGTGTIVLTTKSGGTTVGTKTVGFTLNAAGSVIPTVSTVTIADQNATVVSAVGAYVQSLSDLKGTVSAAGVQGSTISSSSWSMSGTSVPSGSNITPTVSGTVAIAGAATDSRGRVGTYGANITVMPYVAPKINSATFRRALTTGVADDNGTYIRMDLNAAVQSLINGTEKNTLTIKVSTRLYGTSTWTLRNSFVHTAVSYNTNVLVTGGAIFPVNQSFDVKVEVTDKFNIANPAISQAVVSTAAIFMHWSATGVGIGKYHTQGVLDVAGDIYQSNNKVIDTASLAAALLLATPPGVVLATAQSATPNGWLLCNGGAVSRTTYAALFAAIGTQFGVGDGSTTFNVPNLLGKVVVGANAAETEFNALGKTGGAKTHTLAESEIPSHIHEFDGQTITWGSGNISFTTNPQAQAVAPSGNGLGTWQNIAGWANTYGTGGNGAHNNLQPYISLNYIIKT